MCIRDSEKAIYMAQAAESGKPEAIQEKMAVGRLEKFFKAVSYTHLDVYKRQCPTSFASMLTIRVNHD